MFLQCLALLLICGVPEDVTQATAKVYYADQSMVQCGSGTVVRVDQGSFYVLTCSHVVSIKKVVGTGKTEVLLSDKQKYAGKILGYDVNRDLSLIRCDYATGIVPAKFADDEPAFETPIVISGYPNGREHALRFGKIMNDCSFSKADPTVKHMIVQPQVIFGDSGGGVFRRSDGRQIGVLWGGTAGNTYVNRIVDIRIFFKAINFQEK